MIKKSKVILAICFALVFIIAFSVQTFADGTVIDGIPVTDLPFPVEGESPKFTCTFPENVNYKFNKIRWASSVTGDRAGEYTELFEGDVFVPDLYYAVGVKFYPKRGFSFAPANVFIGTINGVEAEVYDRPDDVCIYLIKTFDPIPNPLPFKDLKGYDWSYSYIKRIYEKGVMTGISDNDFGKDYVLTRAMVVQMIYAYENKPDVSNIESKFSDIDDNQWYSDAVKWASRYNIVSGYTDGTFKPNYDITREQLVLILRRYAEFKGKDTSAKASISSFADGVKVSGWAIDGVKWAVAEKIISGREADGKLYLAPQGQTTRAEAATMFCKVLDLIEK